MAFNFNLSNIFGRQRLAPRVDTPKIESPTYGPGDSIMDFDPRKMQPNPLRINTAPRVRQIETPAQDKFREFLSMYPQEQKTSIWQKIADAASGASEGYFKGAGAGVGLVESLRENRRNKRLQDWTNQGEGLRSAAQIESNNLGRVNSADRNEITDRYNQGRVQIGMMNAETARQKLSQGNWDYLDKTESGNPVIMNKTTGEKRILDDVDMFSDPEKLKMQLDAAMARVETQQAGANSRNAATNATSRANNRDTIAGADRRFQSGLDSRAALQDDRQEFSIEHPSGSNRPNTAWEKYQDQQKLMQIATENPGYRGKIIFANPKTGQLYFVPPEQSSGGGVISSLFGGVGGKELEPLFQEFKSKYDSLGSNSPVSKPKPAVAPKKKATGKITITSPDGKEEMEIDASEWATWQARGAKRK